LIAAAEKIGTTPIRNMATIGGNLTCRYTWTEMPAVMIALSAHMCFISDKGEEIQLSAEEFFQDLARPRGLLTKIMIKKDTTVHTSYIRAKKDSSVDIPLLAIAASISQTKGTILDTKVVINRCDTFPVRDTNVETFLKGKNLSDSLGETAMRKRDISLSENEKYSEYKKHLFGACIKQAIQEISDGL